jgi:membrane protein DedA with SNARE-associated domain
MGDLYQSFLDWYGTYGYLALFVGVLLENAGLPVPGETAVLIAGFLCSDAGGGQLHLGWVILVTAVAAVIGDNIGFWLGRELARPRLQAGRRFLFLTPGTAQLAEGYFARYGIWTVFFARFVAGLRVIGALAAGTAGMPWPRFLLANAGGAITWAVAIGLLGYFFGNSWELLHKWLGRGGLIVLACGIVLVGLPYLRRRLHKLTPDLWDRLVRSELAVGLLLAVLQAVCVAVLVLVAKPQLHEEARRPDDVDRRVEEWVGPPESHSPLLAGLARAGLYAGILPVAVLVTVLLAVQIWYAGRSWREIVVLVWALVASELVGLLLLNLLRHRGLEPATTLVWPYGFAGLEPVRAIAVFGTAVALLGRQNRLVGRVALGVATVLVFLMGFGLVWLREQRLSEVLLECVAGSVVLFAGVWWLEGPRLGAASVRAADAPQPAPSTR